MRRILFLIVFLSIRLLTIAQRDCRFTEYTRESVRKNPSLTLAMREVEDFTRRQLQQNIGISTYSPGATSTGVTSSVSGEKSLNIITIPVVVHIIYNSQSQNISDAQVLSQMAVLNTDYRKLNADTTSIPPYFLPLAADCGFQFALAKVDTNGYATSGIVRKRTNIQSFAIDDDMKYTASGGDNAWDRNRYLNIWVCSLTGGVVGYASVPGCPKATDGIVVNFTAFGTTGMAAAPFNLGRTATHEIGHWLNMIHTWGDAYCGNDFVDDTPPQQQADLGDPTGIVISCGNGPYGDMYMNYMDLTNDDKMNMFTYGQRDRMLTLFAPGGFRAAILNSNALTATPIPDTVSSSSDNTPIPESGSASLTIYPNPCSGPVSVVMTDESRIGSILDIYNQLGQKVMSVQVNQLQMQLNVSALQRGLYFIRIRDGKQNSTTKLIKI